MDDIGGERGRKGDALLTPPRSPSPGLLPSSPFPSGSRFLFFPSAAATVLALPASSDPAAGSPSAGLLAAGSPRLAGAMDGGGETLLVRKRKGKKRPAAAAAHMEGDSGAGDRFRLLWRDYDDLLEETEAKKERLANANQRKLGLIAEVKYDSSSVLALSLHADSMPPFSVANCVNCSVARFLRSKYRSFVKGDLQKTHYKLKKKQARYIPSPLGRASVFANHDAAGIEGPSSKNPKFALNQNSIMNDEGSDCHGDQEHDKFDQVGVDEEMIAADVISVCRDTGNSLASEDRRTIPWQDRLALKA
ncbi:hypothetical protein BAE44_0007884 [Dichanthelium oligosanthes]|uniref:No apical meristem-associated C-terminal domain-containing protein n=1 Tax=Dichanthelium oligosanthes TaxID=888268 RepID=A0A1E5W188_9POAL|nr:hypothetical protein BAE44_0007884 [Dichanthelium oligosanthes]